eukprot:35199-Hanusia_phi.AAC.1
MQGVKSRREPRSYIPRCLLHSAAENLLQSHPPCHLQHRPCTHITCIRSGHLKSPAPCRLGATAAPSPGSSVETVRTTQHHRPIKPENLLSLHRTCWCCWLRNYPQTHLPASVS